MKLLIVEDEKALAEVLSDEFRSHDFSVDVAVDGEDALNQLSASVPDLVLLDLLLPKKDGFEVLETMKADRRLKDIPVIILSNLSHDEEIKRGLALGAQDYFVKTQHPLKEIVEKVNRYLIKPKQSVGGTVEGA